MKGKAKIISVTERKSQKGNIYFDCWVNIEGYSVPYRINTFAQNGVNPVKDMIVEVIIDQDRYCNPVVRLRW